MNNYTANSLISVYPFTRQSEGKDVVIGIPENNLFLALPHDAVELLDDLAAGKTIGEAKLIYQAKYGEIPDLEDFIHGLERRGVVAVTDDYFNNINGNELKQPTANSHRKSPINRYHFANFPQSLAQQIFSIPALIGYGFIIALGIILAIETPEIIPNWEAYFFRQNATLMILALMVIDVVTLFIHEMAHLIAARSLGIFCRLGISHRMWTLVAQTDMTGIWNVPRHKRYLPFLAGSLIDLVSAAILMIILFAYHQHWLMIYPVVLQLLQASLLNYLMRLMWQCYFFMRTDFYYVFANLFGCKNLLQDTENFVRNQISQTFGRLNQIDQSHIPSLERQVIRIYAILWLLGRTVAIAVLILINLPLMWHYCGYLFTILSAGYFSQPNAFIDALFLLIIFCLTQCLGLGMWIWSFRKKLN